MSVEVIYPTVRYSEKFITTDRKRPKRSIKSYLDREGLIQNFIIDSAGNQFLVTDVIIHGQAFAPFHNPFNDDKLMKIDLVYEWQQQMTFDEVKSEIAGLFERHPRWCSREAKRHLRDLWDKAETIRGLVDLGYARGNP